MLWETFPGKKHVTKPGTIQAVKLKFVKKHESQKEYYKKTKHANVRVYIRGKKSLLFGKFGVFCFFVTPVLRFILLPYYHQNCPLHFRNNVIFRRKIWDIITISVPFMLKIPNTNPFDLRGFCTFIYQLFVRRFVLSCFY